MSIYKNKNPTYSNQELLRTGESAFYQYFHIKDQWIIRFIKTIIFLILGGIALPLRVVFRRRIGERSIGLIPSIVAFGTLFYIYTIPITDLNRLTKEAFNLTFTPVHDSLIMMRDLYSGEEIHGTFFEMNYMEYKLYEKKYLDLIESLFGERVIYDFRLSEIKSLMEKYPNKLNKNNTSLLITPPLEWKALQEFDLGFYKDSNFHIANYLSLFIFMLAVSKTSTFIRRMRNIKWHSYHRGLSVINVVLKGNQSLIWMIEAGSLLVIALLICNSESVQWRILGVIVLIQSIALFIEELAVHNRKRTVILNMIDYELESRMIAEERANLMEDNEMLQTQDKVKTVSIY